MRIDVLFVVGCLSSLAAVQARADEPRAPRVKQKARPVDREICREAGGFYQDRDDCHSFWQCDLAYRASHHTCPEGLYFNDAPEVLRCVAPEQVSCQDGSNTGAASARRGPK